MTFRGVLEATVALSVRSEVSILHLCRSSYRKRLRLLDSKDVTEMGVEK